MLVEQLQLVSPMYDGGLYCLAGSVLSLLVNKKEPKSCYWVTLCSGVSAVFEHGGVLPDAFTTMGSLSWSPTWTQSGPSRWLRL